jgi:rubrerythrin
MKRTLVIGAAAALTMFLAGMLLPDGPAQAAEQSGTTLVNLQTAFNGESNAHARYLAFAKKADEEGYLGVASLFRAAAHAEGVHMERLSEVIKGMGGAPLADVKTPEVKTTKENLEAALKGESYERDTMYPEFIQQARTERNLDALRVFNFAKSAEAEHAKFYHAALVDMNSWKGAKRDFYVCNNCGFTVETITFEKCPVCFHPKSEYVKVN